MNFLKKWTKFALDAEIEQFGTARICKAYNEMHDRSMSFKYPHNKTSIDDMCDIIKFFEINKKECTDSTIMYEVTFEQLRLIYNLGKDHGSNEKTIANPTVNRLHK